jgi:hypothetical protein
MKTIIAGSRSITDYALIVEAVKRSGFNITEVVSGHAWAGVDGMGEQWALTHLVPLTTFPAEWSRYGRAAGFFRNAEMVAYAEAAIAIWDGRSMGTRSLIHLARAAKLPLFILRADLFSRSQLTLTLTPELCN